MTPELYQRLKLLYDDVLDTPKEQRAQFIDEACRNDSELREHLEALLASHDETMGPLDAPLVNLRDLYPSKQRTLADGDMVQGRFKIVRILGWGGMGEVYEAEDRFLRGVHVALKTILPSAAGDPDLQKRFEREVLLAREVTHPNLCPIHTIFHCDDPPPGYLFLTMKLLPGLTLAARLREPPPMSNEEGLAVLRQTSLGIAAIHAAGIIHRDIKPNNIMVDGSGPGLRLWITDFGLARAYETESTLSSIGTVSGTPGYIAPELFLGHPPSQASDLFALGVVLHEIFTGQKPTPVPGTHSYAISPRLTTPRVPALSVRLITECLQDDPHRRSKAFALALEIIDPKLASTYYLGQGTKFWTRRRFAGAAVASLCAIVGGAWWRGDDVENIVEDIFKPLPDKRYVALLAWPAGDSAAVVSTILDSIGQRLARAEAFAKNLLIISVGDLPDNTAMPANPAESVGSLGANLVLTASLQSTPSRIWLTLRVLEAATQHVYRTARLSCVPTALSTIAERASETAARLLGIPVRQTTMKDTDELQHIPPDAYRLFSEAEQLVSEPNNAGIQTAILKYQQVLDVDPHFALGYAKLAIAYTKQFLIDNNSAGLELAQSNTTLSMRYNPDSAKALLSQALVLLYSGRTDEALAFFTKSLKADPGNPETLIYKAQALKDAGKWLEAERVYREITKERPNYWPAYNDLGWMLSRQANYKEAAKAFKAATLVAPTAAMPLANLGTMALELGDQDEAKTLCSQSLALDKKNEIANLTLGDIAFAKGDYNSSLTYYLTAQERHPKSHLIWRNIGDCYAMLGEPSKVRESYTKAATFLADGLSTNPRGGSSWATLAFYHAKIGEVENAKADLRMADLQGANDVESQFMIAQALALTGRKESALKLVLLCMDRGLSPIEVNLALDLKEIRKDPRYLSYVSKLQLPKNPS